jgi:hypothetical protein
MPRAKPRGKPREVEGVARNLVVMLAKASIQYYYRRKA